MYTQYLDTQRPVMCIDKHVGFDATDGVGIMGDQFQRELLFLDSLGKDSIEVRITSPGGVILDGMMMYDSIIKTKTQVNTYCGGVAASIAAITFCAGNRRRMRPYAKLMFHNPSGGSGGKELGVLKDALVKMIAARCRMTEEQVSKMLDRTTWIGAEEALTLGICTEIDYSEDSVYNFSDDVQLAWREARNIENDLLKKKAQ